MFKKTKFKKALVITLVLIMSLTTVAVAANEIYTKQLTATYGRIKFKVDGKDVTKEIETKYNTPAFTADDRSYVPVRAIAELMGMEVTYDNATHTAELIDVKAKEHTADLTKKDAEIAKLEREVAKLEKEITALKKNVVEETDIETFEKKLNKEFGTYRNVNFDIVLKETRNNVNVSVEIDFSNSTDRNNWNRITTSNKQGLIQDVTNMIAKEFPNADINGSVHDTYYKNDLVTFSKRSNGRVTISFSRSSSSSSGYYDDIVADEFYYYEIDDAEISEYEVGRTTISMDITFSNYYRDEWRDLYTQDKVYMLDRVSDEINYDYPDKDVDISIYMGSSYQGRYTRSYNANYGTFR